MDTEFLYSAEDDNLSWESFDVVLWWLDYRSDKVICIYLQFVSFYATPN